MSKRERVNLGNFKDMEEDSLEQLQSTLQRLKSERANLLIKKEADIRRASTGDASAPAAATHARRVVLESEREFARIVAQVDELLTEFKQTASPSAYGRIKTLLDEVNPAFADSAAVLNAEIEEFVGPIRVMTLDKLRQTWGQWPKTAPTTHEFLDAFTDAVLLDAWRQPSAAFGVLAEPIDVRIMFHFESNQKTRRLDKPEWLFLYFSRVVDPHLNWLRNVLQPLLAEQTPSNTYACAEFFGAVLKAVGRALDGYFKACPSDLLPVLIEESLKFDASLRETYFYEANITANTLRANKNILEGWLNDEIASSRATFHEMLNAPEAWDVDYDSTDARITSRATFLGVKVAILFDSITQLYQPLPASLQLPFFENIQIQLIDRYFGALKQHKNHPQTDLDDYGKVLGSVGYLIDFLKHRNLHPVFIEFKKLLDVNGLLFDEMVINLEAFRSSCIDEINALMKRALGKLFKDFTHKRGTEFYGPCKRLAQRLAFYQSVCNPVDCQSIRQTLAANLARLFDAGILHADSFDSQMGASLMQSFETIWDLLELPAVQQYQQLQACALYFRDGVLPPHLNKEELASIQRRRIQ